MCAIFGVYSRRVKNLSSFQSKFNGLVEASKQRGRDGTNYNLETLFGAQVVLGTSRAAPTTELHSGPLQPYEMIVHNGTIANDKELGGKPDEIDSMVLPRVLVRDQGLEAFAESIMQLKGSFAIAAKGTRGLYLARNYKPLFIYDDGESTWFASMPYMLDHICRPGTAPWELPAFTAIDLCNFSMVSVDNREHNSNKVLVVASAGLDSTTVAAHYASMGKEVTLLHFTYGCRAEKRETSKLEAIAEYIAEKFATSCKLKIFDLPYSQIKTDSPLLNGDDIAKGVEGAEYAHEWVPARNLLMTSMAVAIAEAEGYGIVSLGTNLEESGAYPDNEELMFHHLNAAMSNAVASDKSVEIECPFDKFMKHEIVKRGLEIGAPFHLTWSCYHGGEEHCGDCGPCFMRKTAFQRNGVKDPVMKDS